MLKKFSKVILLIFMPLIFFLLLELFLRVSNIEINTGADSKDGILRFKIVNNASNVDRDLNIETGPQLYDTLSGKYRCRYEKEEKTPNEYRILTLGDSSTYGLGVDTDETYSYYLEKILKQEKLKKDIKVFNFGFPGYSSFQGLLFLEKYIETIEPDYIIAWFGANDTCFAPFYSDREFYYKENTFPLLVTIHKFLYQKLKCYRLLRNINLFYLRKKVTQSFYSPLDVEYKKRRVTSDEFRKNLFNMQAIARKNKANILFLWHCWEHKNMLQRNQDYKPIEPYLDLYIVYSSEDNEATSYILDGIHPNKKGHELIAENLAVQIIRNSIY